jgi:alpha-galactosidase
MSKETVAIHANKEVIAVDQDALGVEGFKHSDNSTNAANDGVEVWFKPLSNDAWAMCFLNRGTNAQPVTFNWKNETVTDDLSKRAARFDTTTYKIRDLWAKKDLGTTAETLTAEVPGHDVLMLRLDKK